MLIVVLVLNVLISLLCFYAAWKLWQIRQVLLQAEATILSWEQNTHNVLYPAPDAIMKGQSGTRHLRQQYRQLELQWQQIQRLLGLISLGRAIWRRYGTRF